MTLRGRLILGLIILAILDMVVPIPFTALLLLYVILEKPPWFKKWVHDIYA